MPPPVGRHKRTETKLPLLAVLHIDGELNRKLFFPSASRSVEILSRSLLVLLKLAVAAARISSNGEPAARAGLDEANVAAAKVPPTVLRANRRSMLRSGADGCKRAPEIAITVKSDIISYRCGWTDRLTVSRLSVRDVCDDRPLQIAQLGNKKLRDTHVSRGRCVASCNESIKGGRP